MPRLRAAGCGASKGRKESLSSARQTAANASLLLARCGLAACCLPAHSTFFRLKNCKQWAASRVAKLLKDIVQGLGGRAISNGAAQACAGLSSGAAPVLLSLSQPPGGFCTLANAAEPSSTHREHALSSGHSARESLAAHLIQVPQLPAGEGAAYERRQDVEPRHAGVGGLCGEERRRGEVEARVQAGASLPVQGSSAV